MLTLQHEATNLAVGDKVEFLCEAQQGSLPIFYSFYIDEEVLGKPRGSLWQSCLPPHLSEGRVECQELFL